MTSLKKVKYIEPNDDLVVKIKNGTDVPIKKNEYYYTEDNIDVPIIKHNRILEIAECHGYNQGIKTELEFGCYNSPYNFCFIYRTFCTDEHGNEISELGEANPNNLESHISSGYPAIMANKRSQDRLLLRRMGLSGKVYSEVEYVEEKPKQQIFTNHQRDIHDTKPEILIQNNQEQLQINDLQNNVQNNQVPKMSISQSNIVTNHVQPVSVKNELDMTVEEARNLIVDFGDYEKNPMSLIDIMSKDKIYFDFLLKKYSVGSSSPLFMKKLKRGAQLLFADSLKNVS